MTNRQIWPDEIQHVENLSFVTVEGTYVKVLTLRLALIYTIFIACAAAIALLTDLHGGWGLLATGVLAAAFAVNVSLVRKIYKIRGYALREKDISYRKGMFFTSVTTIPFSKIQQVSIRMNPISRMFGLYYLDVFNGSQAAFNSISIPGLRHDTAERLKLLLINNADCEND